MQGKPPSGLPAWEELLAVDVRGLLVWCCDVVCLVSFSALTVVVLAFWLRRMSFALCQGRFMGWWVGGEPRKTAGPTLRGAAGRRTLQEGPNVGWGWR